MLFKYPNSRVKFLNHSLNKQNNAVSEWQKPQQTVRIINNNKEFGCPDQKVIIHIRIHLLIGTHKFLWSYKQSIFTHLQWHLSLLQKYIGCSQSSGLLWLFFFTFMTICLKHTLISNFSSWLLLTECWADAACLLWLAVSTVWGR